MPLIPEERLYCPIRREWVKTTPEEQVRQRLLKEMIEIKQYPLSGLAVEKSLAQMLHLQNVSRLPLRRADIVCFIKGAAGLMPLLLIECKAGPWTKKAENQILGYNFYLGARYVALADGLKVKTGTYNVETQQYVFVNELPSFPDLLKDY